MKHYDNNNIPGQSKTTFLKKNLSQNSFETLNYCFLYLFNCCTCLRQCNLYDDDDDYYRVVIIIIIFIIIYYYYCYYYYCYYNNYYYNSRVFIWMLKV